MLQLDSVFANRSVEFVSANQFLQQERRATTTSDGGEGGKGSVVVSWQWQIIIISTSGSDPADKFDFESAERRANDDLN